MKARVLAVLAVLALALVPAFAPAVEAPPGDPSGTVLVKVFGTVAGVSEAEGVATVEFDVREGYEWLDGTETKVPATALHGQRISAPVGESTVVRKGEETVGLDALTPGTKVKALLSTDGQPVTPTCTFALHEVWIEPPPKVHPGTKFEKPFFFRNWHVRGQILGLDQVEGRNVLNLDVRRVQHTPKRFRDEGVRLINLDAYVIVPAKVVITDQNGKRISFDDLRVDDRIKVVTKVLRPVHWMKDEAGEPTPTLLAKRIKVKMAAR